MMLKSVIPPNILSQQVKSGFGLAVLFIIGYCCTLHGIIFLINFEN